MALRGPMTFAPWFNLWRSIWVILFLSSNVSLFYASGLLNALAALFSLDWGLLTSMLPFLPFLTPFLWRNCNSFLSLVISLWASSSSKALFVTSYLRRSCTYWVNRRLIASTSLRIMARHIPLSSYRICETQVSVIDPLKVSLIFWIYLTASVGIHSF